MAIENKRELIIGYTEDCVADLLYYDRKECEVLHPNDIQDAIEAGHITENEIADTFAKELKRRLG